MATLRESLDAVLTVDPAARALEFEGRWRPWRDLLEMRHAIDDLLGSAGLGPGSPVGILLRNRPAPFEALLAVLATDRCVVTLNPFEGDALLAGELTDLRLPVVLGERGDLARPQLRAAVESAGSMIVELHDAGPVPAGLGGALDRPGPGPHHPVQPGVAVKMLTSGTTGRPKRVDLSYRALEASIEATTHYESGRTAGPVLHASAAILWTPLVHISGLYFAVHNTVGGHPTALLERFEVGRFVELVSEHRPKVLGLPPTAMRMVLDADVPADAFAGVRAVRSGTAPLDPALAEEWERRYGMPVLVTYGATEFAGAVAGWSLKDHRAHGPSKRGSVGRAHPGVELRVVDPADGRLLEAGQVGLLEVRAAQTGRDGWVRTTDLGELDGDGFLWIRGRADDAIIRGGFKIAPDTVAAALESHPAVKEASVVGAPDPRLGAVPVAAVELQPDAEPRPTADELLVWARDRLAAYQVPVRLVVVDALPRTPSMKVSQPGVRALFEAEDRTA